MVRSWCISVEPQACVYEMGGRFTDCSALGTSVVDCAISDMDPSSFNAFTVSAQTPLSEHSQINIYLRKYARDTDKKQPSELYHLNQSYRWAQNSAEQFIQILNLNESKHAINTFNNSHYQNNSKESLIKQQKTLTMPSKKLH